MSDKRYTIPGRDDFDGWTLDDLQRAMGMYSPYIVRELARDLIAAQAEIDELRRLAHEHRKAIRTHQKQIRRLTDTYGATDRRVFVAVTQYPSCAELESTIENARALAATWRKLADEADAKQPGDGDCGDALYGAERDTLSSCASDLEATLKGEPCTQQK